MKPIKLIGLTACALMAAWAANAQWTGADVGANFGVPGSATVNGDGSLYIQGGGDDIWGNADSFFYYYKPVSGQWWDAVVRVQAMEGPDWWTKAELMVRRPDASGLPQGGDPHISAMVTRTNGQNELGPQYRGSRDGGSGDGARIVPNTAPPFPNAWLRIERYGAVFNMYRSADGVTWTKFWSQDTSTTANGFDGSKWQDTVLVGLAVTGHDTDGSIDELGAALFSNLSVTPNPNLATPTAAGWKTQPSSFSTYVGTEAKFSCLATNNGNPNFWAMQYKWYKNGTLVSTNPMGPYYTFLATPADAGAVITCVANVEAPFTSVVTPISANATLTLSTGVSYTNGLKEEIFLGATRQNVEIGNVPPANIINVAPTFDIAGFPGNSVDNFTRRVSGWFKAPQTASYVFWVAGDDDTDLFLGQNEDPTTKRLIAQENGWSGVRSWLDAGGDNVFDDTQKCSQTWTPDGGLTFPYSSGIQLTANNYYYIEAVLHDGAWGDNLAVTYRTTDELMMDPMTNGAPTALVNDLFHKSWAATFLNLALSPTNLNVFEGFSATFYSLAATDSEFTPVYQWYKQGVGAIAGATSPNYRIATTTPADSGTFYVVVRTQQGGLSVTSAPVTLNVQQSVFERGVVKNEVWLGVQNRDGARDGTLGPPSYTTTSPKFAAVVNNEGGENYTRKLSGLFIPPVTGDYVFFVNSDDGADLYLSTDSTPTKKYGPIAQQTDWANPYEWLGGGGSLSQKRSDQWSPDNGVTVPYALGIRLQANTRYYMEALHTEGGGGDNVEVTYKLLNDPDPATGTDTKMQGNVIGTMAVRANWVAFTQQPANAAVEPMADAVFTAAGITDSQLAIGSDRAVQYGGAWSDSTNVFVQYQWQKNGFDIPGATDGTLRYGPVIPSDQGAQFVCKMRALGFVADMSTQMPLWSNSSPATLTVSPVGVFEPGFAHFEFWGNGNNPSRTTIENGAAGPATVVAAKPGFAVQLDGGGDPAGHANDYGARIRGWFTPPVAGDYVFFMTSDDDGDLFINPTGPEPQGKKLLARETSWANGPLNWNDRTPENRRTDQFVDPVAGTPLYPTGIPMVPTKKYYMELVFHEGGGGDYAAVTYKLYNELDPANGDPAKLANTAAIGTWAPKSTAASIVQQPQSVTLNTVGPATFTAQGTSDATRMIQGVNADYSGGLMVAPTANTLYQWQRNGSDIPGATAPSYTIPFATSADDGAQFVCKVRGLGYSDAGLNPIWVSSQPATLDFNDGIAPTLAYAAYYSALPWTNQHIVTVRFSEVMDAASLLSATYSIPGAAVQTVLVNSNDLRTVRLVLSAAPTLPVNVTVSGAKDYSGNAVTAGASAPINSVPLISQDIGLTNADGSMDPAYPSYFWVNGPNAYTIAAQGSDIWDTHDGFNFAYETKTGNFDVVVRQKSITPTSRWAKAGLMVRETLATGSRNWNIVNSTPPVATVDNNTGANTVECNRRDTTDGGSGGWDGARPAPNYPNAWVRLKRTGNVLTAYVSADGMNWTQQASQDPSTVGAMTPLPATVYVGICVTAHNNDPWPYDPVLNGPLKFYNVAEFDNYNSSYVPLPPKAQITASYNPATGNLTVSWAPAGGRLFSSPTLGAGANWTSVGTANPAVIPATGPGMFFRVVNP